MPVLENEVVSVEVMTVPGGKTGVAEPTGPVTSRSAALATASQPAEVLAVMIVVSEPVGGSKVRVPGAGVALAAPLRSNDPPAATATTMGAATNRVKNLFLFTGELFL